VPFQSLEPHSLLSHSLSTELGEKFSPIRSAILAIGQLTRGLKSELEEKQRTSKYEAEQTLLSIREAFEEQGVKNSKKFATTVADLKQAHEEGLKKQSEGLEAKFCAEREELTKIAEVENLIISFLISCIADCINEMLL